VKEVRRAAREWARTGNTPDRVTYLWNELRRFRQSNVATESLPILLRLMAIADEASIGMGFAPGGKAVFPTIVLNQMTAFSSGEKPVLLPHVPRSLCRMIPPNVLCVQPKTNVPSVGITLRSLSHNLALLPPVGVVETWRLFAHPAEREDRPLNLLLIPYLS
jgi:hypothetical protein